MVLALSTQHISTWNTTTPSNTYISYLADAFTDTTSNALQNNATTGSGISMTYVRSTNAPQLISSSYNDYTHKLKLTFNKKVVYDQVTVGDFSVFNGANKLFNLSETAEETSAATPYDSSVLNLTYWINTNMLGYLQTWK